MVIPKWLLVIALLASGSEHVTEREGMIPEMSTEIELTLTNELPFEREAEPVTCGVPLARGLADHADELKALDKMLMFGHLYLTLSDDTPRRWLEQTCFYSELLFTCYIHAPEDHPNREQYFARGKALMEDAQSRWPGNSLKPVS